MRIAHRLMALTLFTLVTQTFAASCPPQLRVDLAKAGHAPADIDQICGGPERNAGNAMELFAKAFEAKQSGDLGTSQQLFEQGLRLDPGNMDAKRFLAEVKAGLAASAAAERGPKESCANRPNFVSQAICERRECEKPSNAKTPFCEQYSPKRRE